MKFIDAADPVILWTRYRLNFIFWPLPCFKWFSFVLDTLDYSKSNASTRFFLFTNSSWAMSQLDYSIGHPLTVRTANTSARSPSVCCDITFYFRIAINAEGEDRLILELLWNSNALDGKLWVSLQKLRTHRQVPLSLDFEPNNRKQQF